MNIDTDDSDAFFISKEEAGQRLDKILAQRFSQAGSRTYFQFLIKEHKVLVNGAPAKKRYLPKTDDEVEVEFALTPELEVKPEDIPLQIIYEDDALLIIDKPVGMVVHPAPGHWTGTFVNALLFHCRDALSDEASSVSPFQALRPGIVHRIDKDTSGLLVAAKTMQAQQRLIEMFAGRRVYKEYLAICLGNPGTGSIDAPIGRHPVHRQRMAVLATGEGRVALTHYRTLAFSEKLSLVSIVIATGRTHQIRVHMKHCGHPILGDHLYGTSQANEKYEAGRQMLHAHCMRFEHPITGKILDFRAAIPQDMQQVVKKFKIPVAGTVGAV